MCIHTVEEVEYQVLNTGTKCPLFFRSILLCHVALATEHHFKYLGYLLTVDLKDDADVRKERKA